MLVPVLYCISLTCCRYGGRSCTKAVQRHKFCGYLCRVSISAAIIMVVISATGITKKQVTVLRLIFADTSLHFFDCFQCFDLPSVFLHCWLGIRKSIQPVKIELWGAGMVICLQPGADDLIWSSWCHCHPHCFIKIQNGLTFLVPAYPGCPGKEAIKLVSDWPDFFITKTPKTFCIMNCICLVSFSDLTPCLFGSSKGIQHVKTYATYPQSEQKLLTHITDNVCHFEHSFHWSCNETVWIVTGVHPRHHFQQHLTTVSQQQSILSAMPESSTLIPTEWLRLVGDSVLICC